MRPSRRAWVVSIGSLLAGGAAAPAQPIRSERVASGLNLPIHVCPIPGDPYGVAVSEKPGRIRRLDLRDGSLTVLLDIDDRAHGGPAMAVFEDGGLQCAAFATAFPDDPRVFVHYVDNDRNDVISCFSLGASGMFDGETEVQLVYADPPQFNAHRGGWLEFGPDGFLYCAMGDGSVGGDPEDNAQDLSTLFGKLLRLDVVGASPYAIPASNPFASVPGARGEIWAYGLRNPWRNAFDSLSGELYIADVGEAAWEEVNLQPASSPGGENYGWRCVEGFSPFADPPCEAPGAIAPWFGYAHDGAMMGCSITGGRVYRGHAVPALAGRYLFADFCTARIWSVGQAPGGHDEPVEHTAALAPAIGALDTIVSFGQDAFGEVYLVNHAQTTGEIFRIETDPASPDCNGNGVPDPGEVALGLLPDRNLNGLADGCECLPDLAGGGCGTPDGLVNSDDFICFLSHFGSGDPRAQFDGKAALDTDDFIAFLIAFAEGC